MQLASFGCSLIYGDELGDCETGPSNRTWPALLAKDFGLEYRCFAGGGRGNLMIMDRLTRQIYIDPDRLFVVQWTYIDRFDYSDPTGPHRLATGTNDYLSVLPGTDTPVDEFYYKHFHSEFRDKITNLVYIKTALDLLLEKRCRFFMTCLDDLIWCDRHHISAPMRAWQNYIKQHCYFFPQNDFVGWSRDRAYAIGPGGHPLEQAHEDATDLVRPVIDAILHKA